MRGKGGLGAQVGGCYMEDIPPNKGNWGSGHVIEQGIYLTDIYMH